MNLALTADWKSFVTVLLYFALSAAAPLGRAATICVAALFSETHLRMSAFSAQKWLLCPKEHMLHMGKIIKPARTVNVPCAM